MAMIMANSSVDQTYTTGPEVVAAQSKVIAAGAVAAASKRDLQMSEPPEPVPLKWVITGQVDRPHFLKGSFTAPIPFSRVEQSMLLPDSASEEPWERDYGDFQAGDEVVLFLTDSGGLVKAVPSGREQRDLISVVKDIVAIQGHPTPDAAWLAYVERARLDQGRKAALRSVVREGIDWERLGPVLDRLMANPSVDDAVLAYAFGVVVFGLRNGRWKASQPAVADILGRRYESEGRPKLLLQYILNLKLLLAYAMEEGQRNRRESLRARIVLALRRKEASASMLPEVAQQYRSIRAMYPGEI